jgi:glycosyltransferase involved in cell wall biosynthesis
VNICLVSGEYPPENGWGGVATYTHTMADSLARAGHRVFVVASPAPKAPAVVLSEGVEVHRLSLTNLHYYTWRLGIRLAQLPKIIKRLEYQLAVARKIRELNSRHDLDIVEYADSYADGFFHRLLNRMPYVVKLHVPYWVLMQHHKNETAGIIGRMERSFVRRANAIVSPSRFLADESSRRYRIEPERIEVLPNPVDTSLFAPGLESARSTMTVLFVGWHTELKGVDVLGEAIPKVIESYPNVRFVLVGGEVGGPPAQENSLKARLTKTLAQQILLGQVRFGEFTDDRSELASFYRASTLCVVPSRFDNFPYVCLEAMACGCAVVASHVGGLPEMVDEGITGSLVKPGDANALAQAIGTILADPARGRRMGAAGRSKVLAECEATKIAARTVATYQRCGSKLDQS